MIARTLLLALLLALATPGGGAELPVARVGIVLDGPLSRPVFSREQIRQEIAALLQGEWRLELGEETTRRGDWTLAGARAALEAQLSDESIDVVVTLGVLASQAAADIANLPKPVVAAVVADRELQGFPLRDGVSGKPNFTYLTDFRSMEQQLTSFRRAVAFDDLAILVDADLLDALPRLRQQKEREIEQGLDLRVEVVPVGTSFESVYDRVASADAVYVTPLLRFSGDELRSLAEGLIARDLPSFSMLGGEELDYGLLMNLGGGEQADIVAARRIALNVQRILLGDPAAEIPVALNDIQRLTINMAVAERIGYEPDYSVMADARLMNPQPGRWGARISFTEALAIAVRRNRRLQAAAYAPQLAATELDSARSRLLPQLGLDASRTHIDADRALLQPERSTDVQLSARQTLYSDDAIADWRAAGRRVDASLLDFRARELDVMRAAGEAYLQALRTRAIYEVRQANLEITRENLQLAQVRESIGYSGRADVLRWESRLASDRVDLIDAERALHQAGVRLGQILGSSQKEPPQPTEDSIDTPLGYFRSERFGHLIDSQSAWDRFRAFLVREALERSPELAGLDERIAAGERQRLAARRKFYLPEVALQAGAGERIAASGAGSGSSLFQGLFERDDRSWNVALTASWPIFTGGALRARLSSVELELGRLRAERYAAEEDIEAQMRLALHATGASFLSIGLTEEAARAAGENLNIVADAYGRGAASITDLLEAQDALLNAELGTENARFRYLIDLMGVLRAAADFRLVLEPAYREEFLRRALTFVEDRESADE